MGDKLSNKLPKDITLDKLNGYLSVARVEYNKAHKRARRVDALDRNKLWEAINSKFPTYQLLPQTNHVSYIKNNIVASIYTVGKSAQLQYTSPEDKDIIANLNIALEHIWSTRNVPYYQLQAGERAALLNLGITQVGWDNNLVLGTGDTFAKGQVNLKNIDPLKYYRDPYAPDLDTASYVITWDDYHESVLYTTEIYKEAFKEYKAKVKSKGAVSDAVVAKTDKVTPAPINKPGYHRVHCYWVRQEDQIHEIHVIDCAHVLYVKENIQPHMFPFAELYCNLPAGDLLGTSEPAKIADNSIVYNIMNSILATSEYKNQRPPRFINGQSGINVNAFTKHGNDADRTFVVQGDASKAVHYHQYPMPSGVAIQTMSMMSNDIQLITGVDGKYTGRDTGSVTTTGGVQNMLDQATLIDTTKIQLYEAYSKRLSQLIIYNYIANSATDRKYLKRVQGQGKKFEFINVPFPDIPADIVMEYEINISSEMPKNKARLAATADAMMEKQMQYAGAGIEVDLITPQEWLMMQDIPNKEYFEERMGIQRTQNWQELVAQAVTQYSALLDQGLKPADALNATAQTMQQQQSAGPIDFAQVAQNTQMF